jgi:hypothetical protein
MTNGTVLVRQKRREPRYGILAQDIQISGGAGLVFTTKGHIDINESGMFIPIDAAMLPSFAQSQIYSITWRLWGILSGPQLQATCTVANIIPPFGIDVSFEQVNQPTKSLLRKLVKLLRRERPDSWPSEPIRNVIDTFAAVVAALGVACGLIGLQLVNSNPGWAMGLLGAMIVSIFAYAVLRFIRGPWRLPAWGQKIQWP